MTCPESTAETHTRSVAASAKTRTPLKERAARRVHGVRERAHRERDGKLYPAVTCVLNSLSDSCYCNISLGTSGALGGSKTQDTNCTAKHHYTPLERVEWFFKLLVSSHLFFSFGHVFSH